MQSAALHLTPHKRCNELHDSVCSSHRKQSCYLPNPTLSLQTTVACSQTVQMNSTIFTYAGSPTLQLYLGRANDKTFSPFVAMLLPQVILQTSRVYKRRACASEGGARFLPLCWTGSRRVYGRYSTPNNYSSAPMHWSWVYSCFKWGFKWVLNPTWVANQVFSSYN